MQTNLFDLHCRGATGYVAKPNISEAESFPEAQQDMWRSQISQKPRVFPRRYRICGRRPNIEEAESFAEALPDMWPQAKYRRSREFCRGATGYVAADQISKKPRVFPRRNRICDEAKYRRNYPLKSTFSKHRLGICHRVQLLASSPAQTRLFHRVFMSPVMIISLTG